MATFMALTRLGFMLTGIVLAIVVGIPLVFGAWSPMVVFALLLGFLFYTMHEC